LVAHLLWLVDWRELLTGNYYLYPTSSDSTPSNDLDGGGNNATFDQGGYTIGSPHWRARST
jgi:hypothetical protein